MYMHYNAILMGFRTLLYEMSAIDPRVVSHKYWHSDRCNAGTFGSIRQHTKLIIFAFLLYMYMHYNAITMGFRTLLYEISAIDVTVVSHKCWHSDRCNAGTFSLIRQHAELSILHVVGLS